MLFVDESFNFSLVSRVLGVKSGMPIPFPRSFWLVDMWKYATKQVLLHIKSEKHVEARLHSIPALNPRPNKNLHIYKKLAKKRFPNSKFLN